MNISTSRLLEIMYCPSEYCHPDYLIQVDDEYNLLDNILLNYWLIKYHHLEDLPDNWSSEGSIASLIIANWQMLTRISHYIGGYLLRIKLLQHGATLAIDSQLQSFISLPLKHNVNIDNVSELNTVVIGAAFILELTKQLPRAFHQRIKLVFPYDMNLPNIKVMQTPEHFNLLKMAIAYAKY